MTGQQNTDRIMTTHVGSLPRPHDLLDMMKARLEGREHDEAAYQARVRAAVAECVRRQAETGIDIVCDGEQSKSGFFTYARERLDGLRAAAAAAPHRFRRRGRGVSGILRAVFPDRDAGRRGGAGGAAGVHRPDPLSRRGGAAARHRQPEGGAGGRAARRGVHAGGGAERRRRERTLQHRRGVLSRGRRRAAHASTRRSSMPGFILQIDDPFLSDLFGDPSFDAAQRARAGRDLCRGAERQPGGHPAGAGALPHVLRHQPRPAHPRGGAGRRRGLHAAGERRRLQLRGGQRAARARVSPVGDGEAAARARC